MDKQAQASTKPYLRGSVHDRRRRRAHVVKAFSVAGELRCFFCAQRLYLDKFDVVRFPKCGHKNGRFTNDNVAPACGTCSRAGACCA